MSANCLTEIVLFSSYDDTSDWVIVELAGSVSKPLWPDEPKLFKNDLLLPVLGMTTSVELAGSVSLARWLEKKL